MLQPPLIGALAVTFAVLHTLFWAIPLYLATFARIVFSPVRPLRDWFDRSVTRAGEAWIAGNNLAMQALHSTTWVVSGLEHLSPDVSYLVNSNHQSWTDILVLQRVFNRRIPFLRFFIKQELIWVPVLGVAWWALHFPFMKRYSPETLAKHPELRGKDLETTRRVCARLRGTPVSIINFLEGTRFTEAKHDQQQSPYRHLLRPKSGGFAFVLSAMGEQFKSMLDVTIVYPGGRPSFGDFLCGKVPSVIVDVRERVIPAEMLAGDYSANEAFRARFQHWVADIWSDKDTLITSLLAQDALESEVRAAAG